MSTYNTDKIKTLQLEKLDLESQIELQRLTIHKYEQEAIFYTLSLYESSKDPSLSNETKRKQYSDLLLSRNPLYIEDRDLLSQLRHDHTLLTIEIDYLLREFRRSYP